MSQTGGEVSDSKEVSDYCPLLILMSAVVVAIMILVSKRRRKNLSTTGSSIYSGPYTNTAYSHSSMSRFTSIFLEVVQKFTRAFFQEKLRRGQ